MATVVDISMSTGSFPHLNALCPEKTVLVEYKRERKTERDREQRDRQIDRQTERHREDRGKT